MTMLLSGVVSEVPPGARPASSGRLRELAMAEAEARDREVAETRRQEAERRRQEARERGSRLLIGLLRSVLDVEIATGEVRWLASTRPDSGGSEAPVAIVENMAFSARERVHGDRTSTDQLLVLARYGEARVWAEVRTRETLGAYLRAGRVAEVAPCPT